MRSRCCPTIAGLALDAADDDDCVRRPCVLLMPKFLTDSTLTPGENDQQANAGACAQSPKCEKKVRELY